MGISEFLVGLVPPASWAHLPNMAATRLARQDVYCYLAASSVVFFHFGCCDSARTLR